MTADERVRIEIGELPGLDLFQLRDRWRGLYGSEPPVRMSRELMMMAVAYRIQQQAFGGLSRSSRMKLAAASIGGAKARRAEVRRRMKPGTRFLREWQGRSHEVIAVSDDQYLYQGRSYRSLSAIAREITGTRWSGPGFFGLMQKPKRADAPRSRSKGSAGTDRQMPAAGEE